MKTNIENNYSFKKNKFNDWITEEMLINFNKKVQEIL